VSGGADPLILNLGSRWRCVVSITHRPLYAPEQKTPVLIESVDGWASEPEWTFRRREKSRALTWIRTTHCSARSPVSIHTIYSWISRLVL